MYTFLDWAIIRYSIMRLNWHFVPGKARQYVIVSLLSSLAALGGIVGLISYLGMARVANG